MYLCICVFVYLCICVFVYCVLCIVYLCIVYCVLCIMYYLCNMYYVFISLLVYTDLYQPQFSSQDTLNFKQVAKTFFHLFDALQ